MARRSCTMALVSLGTICLTEQTTISLAADRQPNPYKFPIAKGTALPITEGYWASPPDACSEFEVSDLKRPHVGLKGHPISRRSSDEAAIYAYLSPWLANWPDGICFVLSIKKERAGHYSFHGLCGDTDRFFGTIEVKSPTEVILSRRDEYEQKTGRYGLCLKLR